MGTSPPRSRRRGPPAVAWIILLAVLVGAAAALLSRPVGPAGSGAPVLGELTLNQLTEILVALMFVGAAAWLFLTIRNVGARSPLLGRVAATSLLIILLGVLFVAISGLVHFTPLSPATNSTGGSNPPPGGTSSNGTGNSTPPLLGHAGLTIPGWAGFVAVIAVALIAGVLLVPYLMARAELRRRGEPAATEGAQAAEQALRDALHRLSTADTSDARVAILALYARLLLILGPRLGALDSLTPGEIEREAVGSLGLTPGVARVLTQTFEEARYSTHPMTPDGVDRARWALSEAIVDLARSAGAPR